MDQPYQTYPLILASRGIQARPTDDTLPAGSYLDETNLEEVQENAICSRLGSILISSTGVVVHPLPAAIHSLGRLSTYGGTAWRYAGASTVLYRRDGNSPGAYGSIATGLSGNPWETFSYRPFLSSFPYQFFADSTLMLKDNGTTTTQMGIFQPNNPVYNVQALTPQIIILDTLDSSTGTYTQVNVGAPALAYRVNTTLTTAVTATGLQTVSVASIKNMNPYMLVNVDTGGNAEQVLIIAVTSNGFTATFSKTHASGAAVIKQNFSGAVTASTTATVSLTTPYNLSAFPTGTKTGGSDYLVFGVEVDDPANIEEIRFSFGANDTSFQTNYYMKNVVPSIFQSTIQETANQPDLVSQVIFQEAIGVYAAGGASGAQLNTGLYQWTQLLIPLSLLQTVGNAGLFTPGYDLSTVTGFKVQITTNSYGPVSFGIDAIFVMGGYGPDSYGGVSYDYLYTYYNANTGLESNPSMFMSNVNPPSVTTYVTPRRQPVQITLVGSTDAQVTNIRVYRRGGTLPSNFFRLDQISNTSGTFTYTDQSTDADIEASDPVSFTNDVPVTSTLQVPVNTATTVAITVVPGVTNVTVSTVNNIFVHQQVTIGDFNDPNQETVIVTAVTPGVFTFTAYVQNPHPTGSPVTAQAFYGQPLNIMALAYNRSWFAGDPNNPHFLYYSNAGNVEALSSANFIEIGLPSDPITAICPFQGSLFVSTATRWYGVSPITQVNGAPTVYPTTAVHGVVAPHGWIATETEIWHVAVDGIRTFQGGNSTYRSQDIEFLFQNNGPSPIEGANPADLSLARMTYWNNIVYLSYVGLDSNIYRLAYHTVYKRWRNDLVPATAMYTEPDTNMLTYGDTGGNIHQDRVGFVDYEQVGSTPTATPIPFRLQTAYFDQGAPAQQKQYNEITIDANTGGNTVDAQLWLDDGAQQIDMGSFSTTTRTKTTLNLFNGQGAQGYRASLVLTGSAASETIFYQVAARAIVLPTYLTPSTGGTVTVDSYWMNCGSPESKLCKQAYIDYTGGPITGTVFYDLATSPAFTFLLPSVTRASVRVRFPAVKYRLIRVILSSAGNCQIWPDSKLEVKLVCATKGYSNVPLVT